MTPADKIRAAIAVCEARHGEFWRRLAGSLRKSLTMLEDE